MVGIVDHCENGVCYATQRNRFFAGDTVEILAPGKAPVSMTLPEICNGEGERIETVNHAMMDFSFPCAEDFPKNSIIRKPVAEDTEDKNII